jgi:hypothetical protein
VKKFYYALTVLFFLSSNVSFPQALAQPIQTIQTNKINQTTQLKNIRLTEKKSRLSQYSINKAGIPSSGASVGFNTGIAIIEDNVGFAIGGFAEIKANDFAFVPQANYWNASKQSNFELAGLARFYLSKKQLIPYLDGGLGVNFYNSDTVDFTKLSLLFGGGVEMTNVSSSFNLLFDAKYKLIVNDGGNISCYVFTVGMKFPFR